MYVPAGYLHVASTSKPAGFSKAGKQATSHQHSELLNLCSTPSVSRCSNSAARSRERNAFLSTSAPTPPSNPPPTPGKAARVLRTASETADRHPSSPKSRT